MTSKQPFNIRCVNDFVYVYASGWLVSNISLMQTNTLLTNTPKPNKVNTKTSFHYEVNSFECCSTETHSMFLLRAIRSNKCGAVRRRWNRLMYFHSCVIHSSKDTTRYMHCSSHSLPMYPSIASMCASISFSLFSFTRNKMLKKTLQMHNDHWWLVPYIL